HERHTERAREPSALGEEVRDDREPRAADLVEPEERTLSAPLEVHHERGDLVVRIDLVRDPPDLVGRVLLEGLDDRAKRRPRASDHCTAKTVAAASSIISVSSARAVSRSRIAYSRSAGNDGSPNRYGTALPWITRGTPAATGMVGIADTNATGIPTRSISLA